MRIVSGKYARRKIITPKVNETRPTTDRFKEPYLILLKIVLKLILSKKMF